MDDNRTKFDDIENTVLLEIADLMNDSAERMEKEMEKQSQLLSPKAVAERRKLEIKSSVRQIKNECLRLDEAFTVFEKNKHRFLNSQEIHRVFDEIQKIGLHLDREAILNSRDLKEKTLQEIFEIPDFILFSFYRVGYGLFEENVYPDASQIFFFLTIISPFVRDYWMAFGVSEKQNGDYQEALKAFAMAALMNISDPEPHLISAECYISLKDVGLAIAELELAKRFIPQHQNADSWQVHLEAIQKDLERVAA